MMSKKIRFKLKITLNDSKILSQKCAMIYCRRNTTLEGYLLESDSEYECTYYGVFELDILSIKEIEIFTKRKTIGWEESWDLCAKYIREGKYLEIQDHKEYPIHFIE